MYVLFESNQLARVSRISDGILKTYFMWIYFREHQKPKYYAKTPKERKEFVNLQKEFVNLQKVCEFAEFYPHKNISTKLANKYTLENEMKLKNC